MALVNARRALLFDVGDLAIGGDLPVMAGHTPACKRGEAEEMNETHHGYVRRVNEQFLYRSE